MIKVMARGNAAAEVLIYDPIGENWYGDGLTAKRFRDDLAALGEVQDITVRINSPGGEVFDGFAIYNALKQHPATVTVHVDGMAASIASVIAMAGDEIRMAENAMLMIHDPWTIAMGSAEDFRRKADLMDQVKGNLVDTYARRTGQDAGRISELMAAETWMTAAQARELGFVDDVTEELQVAARFDVSRFRNPPKGLPIGELLSARGNVYRAKLADIERRAQQFGAFPK